MLDTAYFGGVVTHGKMVHHWRMPADDCSDVLKALEYLEHAN
jgi:hypothetical protein